MPPCQSINVQWEISMNHSNIPRAELVLIYKFMCRVWVRSVRWDEPFLSYLLGMAVVYLWERLGGEWRLPSGFSAERQVDPTESTPGRRRGHARRSTG